MAHSKQALKRVRQNERDRLNNKSKMTRMKTEVKKLLTAVAAGEKEKAAQMLPKVCQVIDKAAKQSVIHKNTASRRKSQVVRAVGAMA
ncbi:MAG: 30S ribosomal protein S20 [Planctomycetes bacterium]|nr:30S ribosomal protein S20 [Planctomycetota bacterium]